MRFLFFGDVHSLLSKTDVIFMGISRLIVVFFLKTDGLLVANA